jgi:hypothetical protein
MAFNLLDEEERRRRFSFDLPDVPLPDFQQWTADQFSQQVGERIAQIGRSPPTPRPSPLPTAPEQSQPTTPLSAPPPDLGARAQQALGQGVQTLGTVVPGARQITQGVEQLRSQLAPTPLSAPPANVPPPSPVSAVVPARPSDTPLSAPPSELPPPAPQGLPTPTVDLTAPQQLPPPEAFNLPGTGGVPPVAATPTTAEISGGGPVSRLGPRELEILRSGRDAASWLGPEGQKALQAVLITEGGLSGARGDQGASAGPLQFFGTPSQAGQLTNFAQARGLTLEQARQRVETNPNEAVAWAIGTPEQPGYLGAAIQRGQQRGLNGADLATYAQRTGQVSVSPERAGANYQAMFGGGGGPVGGAAGTQPTIRDISQFGDAQLTAAEAQAACGPATAVRFAQRFGRNPTLREAIDLARSVGWTEQQGMAGIVSEKALMDKMGVPNKLVPGAEWGTFAEEAKTGNPVTISTRGHYFYADGYDPTSNRFHVGRSGMDLKGGSEWMSPQEMTTLMGPVQGALLADAPTVNAPSNAVRDENPVEFLDRQRQNLSDSLGGAVSAVQRTLGGLVSGAQATLEATQRQAEEVTRRGRETLDAQLRELDTKVLQAQQNARQAAEDAQRRVTLGISDLGQVGTLGGAAARTALEVSPARTLLQAAAPTTAQSPLDQLGNTIGSAISTGLANFLGTAPAQATTSLGEQLRNQATAALNQPTLTQTPSLQVGAQRIGSALQAAAPDFLSQPSLELGQQRIAQALDAVVQQPVVQATLETAPRAFEQAVGGIGRAVALAATQPQVLPAALTSGLLPRTDEQLRADEARQLGAVRSGSLFDAQGNPLADFRPSDRFGLERIGDIFDRAVGNVRAAPDDPAAKLGAALGQLLPTGLDLTRQANEVLSQPFRNLLGETASAIYGDQFPLIREVRDNQGPDAALNAFYQVMYNPDVGVYGEGAGGIGGLAGRVARTPGIKGFVEQGPLGLIPAGRVATGLRAIEAAGPAAEALQLGARGAEALQLAQEGPFALGRLAGPVGRALLSRQAGVPETEFLQRAGGSLADRVGAEVQQLYSSTTPSAARALTENLAAAPRGTNLLAAETPEAARTLRPGPLAVELDPARVGGTAAPEGVGYTVQRAVPGAVRALIARDARQVAGLAEDAGLARHYDFGAAESLPAGGGVRIPVRAAAAEAAGGLRARQPAEASALFAARLGGAAAGGAAGYAATPEGATPEERVRNVALGAGLGLGATVGLGNVSAWGRLLRGTAGPRLAGAAGAAEEAAGPVNASKFPSTVREAVEHGASETPYQPSAPLRGGFDEPQFRAYSAAQAASGELDAAIRTGKAASTLSGAEINAVRNAIGNEAAQAADAARAIIGGQDSSTNLHAFWNAGQRLMQLARTAEGSTSGMPRPRVIELPSRQAVEQITKLLGGDKEQLITAATEFDKLGAQGYGPIKQARFFENLTAPPLKITNPADWLEWVRAIRYNSMLSGPRTVEINTVGFASEVLWRLARTQAAELVLPSQAGTLRGETRGLVTGFHLAEQAWAETWANGVTLGQALRGEIPVRLAERMGPGLGREIAGTIDLPGRILSSADQAAVAMARNMIRGGRIGRELEPLGLQGSAWDREFAARMAKALDPATETEITRAAEAMVFRGELGTTGRIIEGLARIPVVGNLVLPFVRTPYRIMAGGIERSPLGLLGTAWDVLRAQGGTGPYARGYAGEAVGRGVTPLAERLGNNLMGTTITGFLYMHALDGNLSASGPDSPAERNMLRASQGWQPYSIRIGNQWIGYGNWGPLAIPLSMAASVGEAQRYRKAGQDKWAPEVLGSAGLRMSEALLEQSYVSTLAGVIKGLTGGGGAPAAAADFINSVATTLVPYGSALSTVALSQDPYARRVEGVAPLQAIEARLPVLREQVPVVQDVLGRPAPNLTQGLGALNPLRVSEVPAATRETAVLNELDQYDVRIVGVPKTITIRGVPVELTPEEQQVVQQRSGPLIVNAVTKEMQRPGYQSLSDKQKHDRLDRIVSAYRQAAQRQTLKDMGTAELRQRMERGSALAQEVIPISGR